MIAYYITIEILGTELLIDEILKILGNKIKIGNIIHPNDKNPKRDEKYGFGCISLSHPKVYIADDELVDYLSWLSDFINVKLLFREYFYPLKRPGFPGLSEIHLEEILIHSSLLFCL